MVNVLRGDNVESVNANEEVIERVVEEVVGKEYGEDKKVFEHCAMCGVNCSIDLSFPEMARYEIYSNEHSKALSFCSVECIVAYARSGRLSDYFRVKRE